MTKSIGVAFVFAAATAPVLGEVITLTPANFDEVARVGNCLVKFYAPWCGHCKSLAPEYIAASDEMEEDKHKGAVMAELDCDNDENKELCSEFGIRGFPTLKWFPKSAEDAKSEPVEYDGGRNKAGLLTWIEDIQKPVVQEVNAVPEVSDKLQVVLEAAEVSDAFNAAAEKNRKHASFFFVKSDGDAKCTILKQGDGAIDVELDKISEAVDTHRFPYFGELNGETYAEYTGREGKKMFWTLLDFGGKDMAEAVDPVREDMTALAKEHTGYSFTYTDTVQFAGAIEGMLGVTSFPAVVVQDGAKKFIQAGEVTKDSVAAFLAGIEDGSIEPTIKSEDIPEEQPKAVRTIVAKSLKDELFNDKDVLLKVYAPWCGHCKTLAPEYDAAAEALKALGVDSKVHLGKLDGTLNDSTVDGLEWSGFPTLVFVKAGSEEVKEYNGPRTKAGILEWIAENSDQEDVKALTKDAIAAAFDKADEAEEDDEEDDKEEL